MEIQGISADFIGQEIIGESAPTVRKSMLCNLSFKNNMFLSKKKPTQIAPVYPLALLSGGILANEPNADLTVHCFSGRLHS